MEAYLGKIQGSTGKEVIHAGNTMMKHLDGSNVYTKISGGVIYAIVYEFIICRL